MKKKCECDVQDFNTCTCDHEPKFAKPGLKKKKSKIWNQKSRTHDIKKPVDTYCRFCNHPDDGTCYFHHCEVPELKMKYGSGTGRKIDDNLTVWAHHKCGTEMSVKADINYSVSYMQWKYGWLLGIIETHLV